MKGTLTIYLVATAAMIATAQATNSGGIAVSVNGVPVKFAAGQPIEWTGHVMVPMRGVFEQMGGKVEWDGTVQMVTVTRGETTIKMTVGEMHALKNEETIVTNVKSILRSGTCYVPLRFLAETIDAKVQWEGATRSVHITTERTIASPSSQRKMPPPSGP